MIVGTEKLMAFSLVAFTMVCTPGPNMMYLLSRSILQGKMAGMISLAGVVLGFVFYMFSAAFGLTALLFAVPFAYEILQWAGVIYLLWLAWQAVVGHSVLEVRQDLSADSPQKLFMMGFMTNLLNPKIALLYLSLLPQFVCPEKGNILLQNIELGVTQILISFTVNALIVLSAGLLSKWLSKRPTWIQLQRWLMASVLAALAVRLACVRKTA